MKEIKIIVGIERDAAGNRLKHEVVKEYIFNFENTLASISRCYMITTELLQYRRMVDNKFTSETANVYTVFTDASHKVEQILSLAVQLKSELCKGFIYFTVEDVQADYII